MNFLDQLLYPPRYEYLVLAQYLIIFISLIFVIYAAFLFGGTFFSIIYRRRAVNTENPLWQRFSEDLLNTLAGNFLVGLGFLILPLIVLNISYSQLLYGSEIKISQYLNYTTVFFFLGLVCIALYRRNLISLKRESSGFVFWGILGLIFLLIGFYAYSNSTVLIFDPEKGPFIRSSFPNIFSASSFARFIYLILLLFALTGSGILFFFIHWMGGKEGMDEKYRKYVGKLAATITMIFTFFLPVFFLWFVKTLPHVGLTNIGYELVILSFLILAFINYFLYLYIVQKKYNLGVTVFVLFLVYVLVVNVFDHVTRTRAMEEHLVVLKQKSQELEARMKAKPEEMKPKVAEADLKLGAEIYAQRCSACHRFDMRVVGPPYKEVLSKYEDDREALVEFILNPVKIDPNYPPMPNLALTPNQAKAVAEYLMQTYITEYKNK